MAKVTFCWLSGYSTLGRKLVDGATSIRMFNEEFAVKAAVETLGGFSARAGQSELVEWIARFSNQPEVALVVVKSNPAGLELCIATTLRTMFLHWMPKIILPIKICLERTKLGPHHLFQPMRIPSICSGRSLGRHGFSWNS